MIDAASVAEIISTYQKHGWLLRRVLLSDESRSALQTTLSTLLEGVSVHPGRVDAAWFSRPPTGGGVPWEVRFLGSTPFALLENIDESSTDFEDRLSQVENRLIAALASKKSA
jgi:hypothetical protein